MMASPTTGRTKRIPPTENARSPAKMMISLPRYVPTTVRAASSGNASARTMRTDIGVATRSPDAAILGGIVLEGRYARVRAGRWRVCSASEHLLQHRGNVVAPAVEDRAHQAHAHA